MTRKELLAILRNCARDDDTERAHADADAALISFINDGEITAAYGAISKWYA